MSDASTGTTTPNNPLPSYLDDPKFQIDGPMLTVHRSWIKQPKALAYRLQDMIVGRLASSAPYFKENGHWVLDGGNNWFLRIDDDQIHVSYRYGHTVEFWNGFKALVETLLG